MKLLKRSLDNCFHDAISLKHVWKHVVLDLSNNMFLKFRELFLNLQFSYFEVLHVSGQIDIMCQELREISSTKKSHPSATRSLIKRHQKIISLSNNIDNFFSFVALIQFVWNTIVICSIGFMIVIVSKAALFIERKQWIFLRINLVLNCTEYHSHFIKLYFIFTLFNRLKLIGIKIISNNNLHETISRRKISHVIFIVTLF